MKLRPLLCLAALVAVLLLLPAYAAGILTVKEGTTTLTTTADTLRYGNGFDLGESDPDEVTVCLDASEVLSGDVNYSINAGQVTGIYGRPIALPESGVDDWRSLTYDPQSGGAWTLTRADFSCEPWSRQSIQNANGSLLTRVWTAGGALNTPWIAPRAGMLTGLSVCTASSIGGSGSYTVEIQVNGVPTGITTTVAAGNYKNSTAVSPSSFVSFTPNAEITLHDTKTGTVTNVGATAQFFGCWVE